MRIMAIVSSVAETTLHWEMPVNGEEGSLPEVVLAQNISLKAPQYCPA